MALIHGSLPLWIEGFDGSGYGYWYGDGSGDGDGDGYGYGYGYGDGSGDGSGSGDGYGYWNSVAQSTVNDWPVNQRDRFFELLDTEAFLGFWKSNSAGFPSNGGISPERAESGLVQTVSGPLHLCHSGTLHATLKPEKWKGERLWIVALFGDIVRDDDKVGALRREIIGEVQQ